MTADEYDTGEETSPTTRARSGDPVAGGAPRGRCVRATSSDARSGADRFRRTPGSGRGTDGTSADGVRIAGETTASPPTEATRYV